MRAIEQTPTVAAPRVTSPFARIRPAANIQQELEMQTEPMNTDAASNGHTTGSTPAQNAAAGTASSGITREFQNFVADMEDLIESSTSLTGEDLARAKASLYARVATARAFVEEMPGAVSDRARDTAKAADSYVREQPWQAIGITAAVGVLIGFLLGRRG
jgi:ElaB/YqjD/DUF883 family membrane-anchored ribosome-binding protein